MGRDADGAALKALSLLAMSGFGESGGIGIVGLQ